MEHPWPSAIIFKFAVTPCFTLLTAGMVRIHVCPHLVTSKYSLSCLGTRGIGQNAVCIILRNCPCYKVITVSLLHIHITHPNEALSKLLNNYQQNNHNMWPTLYVYLYLYYTCTHMHVFVYLFDWSLNIYYVSKFVIHGHIKRRLNR